MEERQGATVRRVLKKGASVPRVRKRTVATAREARMIDAIVRVVLLKSEDAIDLVLAPAVLIIAGVILPTRTATTTAEGTTVPTTTTTVVPVVATTAKIELWLPEDTLRSLKAAVAATLVAISMIGPVENSARPSGWKNSFARIKKIAAVAASLVWPRPWATAMDLGTKVPLKW